MSTDKTTLVRATSMEGNNILAFDAVGYAKAVSEEVVKLSLISPDIALAYLSAVGGVNVSMTNCNPSFDNSRTETVGTKKQGRY